MSGANPTDHRRKWDRNTYEQMANKHINSEIESLRRSHKEKIAPKRAMLQARDYKVDLEANLNRSQVISKTGPGSSQAGYYCEVCDCVVKDSINYLDHINGKKHQRNLGMSMRVKRSTLDDVKDRFSMHKKKKDIVEEEYSLDERMKQIAEEEEKLKSYKKLKKAAKRQKEEGANDEDIASKMGFGSFGSKKPR